MITGTSSAEIINVEQVGNFGNDREIGEIAVVGNYAYVLQLCDLVVLSVTDPATPVEMHRIKPPNDRCFDSITSSGTYVYLTASDYSTGTILMVFDIVDPANPKLVGQYNDQDFFRIVEVSNNHAYLLSYSKGCLILDVSNPAEPKHAGQYNGASYITSLDVSDQYLYLTTSVDYKTGSLMVLDISDPAEPKLIGQYANNYLFNDVAVSGQYAFLANDINGLIILNISDPVSPQHVGRCSETGSKMDQVLVSGKYAYVVFDFNPIESATYSLGIVNVSDPNVPKFADSDGNFTHALYSSLDWCSIGAVSGNHIYMVPEYGGLSILKVSPADHQTGTLPGAFIAIYDNLQVGTWVVENVGSSTGIEVIGFGWSGVEPIVGDWDGDGFKDVGVYNRAGNNFLVRYSDGSHKVIGLGWPGVTPVVGDFDGDGDDDVGVYDNNGTWALNTDTGVRIAGFGWSGTEPIVGDWNGDGIDEAGIYNRPGNNFLVPRGNGAQIVGLGWAGVIPIVGNWDSDVNNEVGVYDPQTSTFALAGQKPFVFGKPGSQPVVGDVYFDGITEVGVCYPDGTIAYNTSEQYDIELQKWDGSELIGI